MRDLWGFNLEHVRVVPNGVDEMFQAGDRAAARKAVNARWGINAPFVLHVGSLEPRKGLDVLIDAAVRSRTEGGRWRGRMLAEKARSSGVCDLLGPVAEAELVDLYRSADVFAAPALYEGFGIAPLEAMASATPVVIAAGSGGLEEISGPGAIVVQERTAEAWQISIEAAMKRPAELLERGATLARRFRWPAVAAETREVLAEAASGAVKGSRPDRTPS
jgi:glycosyltransferase involved in cell wall biosynthesis